MSNVVDFDSHRIAPFLMAAIEGFLRDPPDSDFQAGYLSALLVVYREGLRREGDARLDAAEKLCMGTANTA